MFRLFFALGVLMLTSLTVWAEPVDCANKSCLAVVDAGSSGSRLHIYSFERDSTQTPVNIREEFVRKPKNLPGLASIRCDVNTVNTYMDELFKDIKTENIPVYFYATAGMRLLPGPEQKTCYQNISKWFGVHPQWTLLSAKTIAGNEEGLYGWLALNKQLGRLENQEGYAGFMDMGGASVQLATAISKTDAIQDKEHDLVKVNIYGRDITLFVHSFLGLGQTEVNHQSLDKKACYPQGYEIANNLFGKGDAEACETEMEKIVNDIHNVKDIVQPVLADVQETPWYASGGVVFTVTNRIFQFNDNKFTNAAFLAKAQTSVCQQSWENLLADNPDNPFLYGYCQFAAYDYALMVKGYGFAPEQEIHYLPAETNPDWTLGVVLFYKTP